MSQKLWEKLTHEGNLKRGWHLAREDAKKAFIQEPYLIDAFTEDFENNILEIRNRLISGTYRPSPLIHIEIPKNSLATRPGSYISIDDSIVLHTIMFLIAQPVDTKLHDNVYSYRLKEKFADDKRSIFRETDLLDIPYLKRKTISTRLDPFDPWYLNWPEFDEKSRKSFEKQKLPFMATSDISAYFENIQIPILRDQLIQIFHDETKIVNSLVSFLEAWATKTSDGRAQWRGIPQGNSISSFLGNAFLIPVDKKFERFCQDKDAEYYRYMDDIRIFTKQEKDARQAVLELDRALKAQHLNAQSAKTKILKEQNKEISNALIDKRLDQMNLLIKDIHALHKSQKLTQDKRKKLIKKANALVKESAARPNSQCILGIRKRPLNDSLDLRLFKRWVHAHISLNSPGYVKKILYEIKNNPDFKMTMLVTRTFKSFPGQMKLAEELFEFIKSDLNIFPHQEAEILEAFRFLSEIPQGIVDYCLSLAFDANRHFYVRVKALQLLTRVELSQKQYRDLLKLFNQETNQEVQVALAGNLVKFRGKHSEILKSLVFHPNEKVKRVGKYFRSIKWNQNTASRKINYLFDKKYDLSLRLCDCMPELYLLSYIAAPEMRSIKKTLIRKLKENMDQLTHRGHRKQVQQLHQDLVSSYAPSNENSVQDAIIEINDAAELRQISEDF